MKRSRLWPLPPKPLLDSEGRLIPMRHKLHLRVVEGRLPTPCMVIWPRNGYAPEDHRYASVLLVDGRYVVAHRHVWAAANGVDPGGQVVHHKCFRGRCVNPAHLALVSMGENSRMRNFGALYDEPKAA